MRDRSPSGTSGSAGKTRATPTPSWFATRLETPAVSILVSLALLGLGECYCRLFTRITFLDNSRNLFVPNRFGSSRGNLINGEGVSFGKRVYTDEHGFRVDPSFKDRPSNRATLVLGDSVAFGCGVDEPESALGRLRRARPDWRIYNASVIGYSLRDYRNVVEAFVPKHPEVKLVYLLMCLNDIDDVSATEIKKSLGAPAAEAPPTDAVTVAKRLSFLQDANDWLRSRSKLYIFIKNLVSDTSLRIFLYDLQIYRVSGPRFGSNMHALAAIRDRLQSTDIDFKVIVLPYEAQLRTDNADFLLPQRMITGYLREHAIDYIDTTERLRKAAAGSDLYLFGDAMHLSPRGHQVLYDVLLEDMGRTTGALESHR